MIYLSVEVVQRAKGKSQTPLHVKIQVARRVGWNTAFPGAWLVYEAKNLLGLADGHAALVARGRQSCWWMKASLLLPHYLLITCHHSSVPMAKISVPLIPPSLLGKHGEVSASIREKIFAGHLTLGISCPWICYHRRPVYLLVGSMAYCLSSKEYIHSSSEAEAWVWVWECKLPFG